MTVADLLELLATVPSTATVVVGKTGDEILGVDYDRAEVIIRTDHDCIELEE